LTPRRLTRRRSLSGRIDLSRSYLAHRRLECAAFRSLSRGMRSLCVKQCHLEARNILSKCRRFKPVFDALSSISNLIVSFAAAESVVASGARFPEPYCEGVCGVCLALSPTRPCGVLVKRHRALIEFRTYNPGYVPSRTLPWCVRCVSSTFTSKAARGVSQATPCGAAWRCVPSKHYRGVCGGCRGEPSGLLL
jgi:hypothetical protein